jgi:predicted DsbA family dithiol-disulfide isomerase
MRAVAPRFTCASIPLVLHGDVLDPWCWIAERRIAAAAEPWLGRFAPLVHVPLPRRWEPRAPSATERSRRARELARARKEADAPPFTPELWAGPGPASASSAPALVALAAARLQGDAAESALRAALREAALVSGIDVTRSDVIVEVAARAGLELSRFLPAFEAPATERIVREQVRDALERGVVSGPALVIAEEWLVSGLRSLRDYRLILKRYAVKRAGAHAEHVMH